MIYYTSVILITLLALMVLSIRILENDRIPRSKKRLFLATNFLIALAATAEYAGVHLNGNPDFPRWMLPAVKAIDYTLTPMTGGALILLMGKPGQKHPGLWALFAGNTAFQLLSVFHSWMIVVDDQNHYARGPLYPGLYRVLLSHHSTHHPPNAVLRKVLPEAESCLALYHYPPRFYRHRHAGAADSRPYPCFRSAVPFNREILTPVTIVTGSE